MFWKEEMGFSTFGLRVFKDKNLKKGWKLRRRRWVFHVWIEGFGVVKRNIGEEKEKCLKRLELGSLEGGNGFLIFLIEDFGVGLEFWRR